MLSFRTTNIIVLLLVVICASLDRYIGISFYWYLVIAFVYSLVLFYGSYYVNSQFYFKVLCSARTEAKQVAISFDDGPLDDYTPEVLRILKAQGVFATFFCIGKRAALRPDLLRLIHAEGHIIANHSYSHSPVFDLFGAKKMQGELQQMNEVVRQELGLTLRWFRPPYGVTNPNLGKAVKRAGLEPIGWNIRSLDTVIKDKDRLLEKVVAALKPGAIILFHDTCLSTTQMLNEFIRRTREKGYEIVPLDKLVNLQPYA